MRDTTSKPYEMDVQLHSSFAVLKVDPVSTIGELSLELTIDEARELRDLLVETVLNWQGYTEVLTFAKDVETGDVIPGLGPISEVVPQSNHKIYMIVESTGCEVTYPYDHHMIVRRRIS
jgi:hypothetical protein